MKIWVDADACPGPVKDILYKAAARRKVDLTLVANKVLHPPPSTWITSVLVPQGDDVADHHIILNVQKGDLVITADIPLAAEVLDNKGFALNPRGTLYTEENIAERLGMRDFMDELRTGGIATGGPPPFSKKDIQHFANALDRFLAKRNISKT